MYLLSRAVLHVRNRRPFIRPCHAASAVDHFTDRTRDALSLAQDEARRLGHDSLGTEHVVLGILRRSDSVGARLLNGRGVQLDAMRTAIETSIGRGGATTQGDRGLTPRLKRILDRSGKEAMMLNHSYVGTEHLLLSILREGGGVTVQILRDHGITADMILADIVRIVGKGPKGDRDFPL